MLKDKIVSEHRNKYKYPSWYVYTMDFVNVAQCILKYARTLDSYMCYYKVWQSGLYDNVCISRFRAYAVCQSGYCDMNSISQRRHTNWTQLYKHAEHTLYICVTESTGLGYGVGSKLPESLTRNRNSESYSSRNQGLSLNSSESLDSPLESGVLKLLVNRLRRAAQWLMNSVNICSLDTRA